MLFFDSKRAESVLLCLLVDLLPDVIGVYDQNMDIYKNQSAGYKDVNLSKVDRL